ncbi:DUF4145 domain-containing protein [Pseudomonas sp. SD17-1]|uniref:DUF4145 domain-containing protein n=1 Tax=Pseudomonas sp. SD17-1 TaxID=2976883 RepID=UPI0023DB9D9E|nr:DUF4145 domain-containing protein [Pseudomonas sp. SD17-1]WEJ21680.1 DUF4145 domain-containing protein [Pseudomonas sp. SD17-1]
MSTKSAPTVWNHCDSCNRKTNHHVEGKHLYQSNSHYDYHYGVEHSIVKCRGCNCVSFRVVEYDYEGAYPDENEDWIVPESVEIFPGPSKSKLDIRHVPDTVGNIFNESCQAFSSGSYTLAGIGFRATIEAICNDLNISGKELSTRINLLSSRGFISKKDSMRLHSIRFMGNDAAHDVKKPSITSLQAALTIVEHLLTTVYILEKESSGKLESIIDDYANFEKLLNEKLSTCVTGDEIPLAKILGKDVRLISGSSKIIEDELHRRIGKKEYTKLSFGKVEKYAGSKDKLQHYIIQ